MKTIGYNHSRLGMAKTLDLYRALITPIAHGQVEWGNTHKLDEIAHQSVLRLQATNIEGKVKAKAKSANSEAKPDQVTWCKDFNAGNCPFTDSHSGLFRGKTVQKSHICRFCWTKSKVKLNHRETDPSCPSHD